MSVGELAAVYACLALHDDGIPITVSFSQTLESHYQPINLYLYVHLSVKRMYMMCVICFLVGTWKMEVCAHVYVL